jgi:hypothetical protein
LGQVLYQYEKQRPKKHLPDLSRFKLSYDWLIVHSIQSIAIAWTYTTNKLQK